MSWFWIIMFLNFTFGNEARHLKKLPSAVVVGTVYCDTCFHQPFSKPTHFISGATVAVECKDNASSSNPNFRQEVKTDKQGEFQVHLPFHVGKHVKRIELCSVQLIRSNQPFCAVAATATSSTLSLKSRKQGTHIFSAGFFTFKPLNQPEVCDEKPIVKNSVNPDPISNPNNPAFPPPLKDPPISNPPALIPLPPALGGLIPVPRLPPLLPGIPLFPPKEKKENALKQTEALDNKVSQPMIFPFPPPLLPPNPLLPPPSLFPPNPFRPPPSVIPPIFPSPPPSIFPPLLPTPPTPPFFGLPPIPGLTPSPPPPPPQIFPIPFPPFPFQPTPGFPGPGVPPAEASSGLKTSSP